MPDQFDPLDVKIVHIMADGSVLDTLEDYDPDLSGLSRSVLDLLHKWMTLPPSPQSE